MLGEYYWTEVHEIRIYLVLVSQRLEPSAGLRCTVVYDHVPRFGASSTKYFSTQVNPAVLLTRSPTHSRNPMCGINTPLSNIVIAAQGLTGHVSQQQ